MQIDMPVNVMRRNDDAMKINAGNQKLKNFYKSFGSLSLR